MVGVRSNYGGETWEVGVVGREVGVVGRGVTQSDTDSFTPYLWESFITFIHFLFSVTGPLLGTRVTYKSNRVIA